MVIKVVENYSLDSLNTLGFPASAEYFCKVSSEADLVAALTLADEHQWPITLLGGGSNLVLTQDIHGLVIQIAIMGREQRAQQVVLGAGESWHDAVVWSVLSCGLQGLECLALIPGTVGAAPVQNIGAYGVELADLNPVVRAWDRNHREFVEMDSSQADYGYRNSLFKQQRDRFVITQVHLDLSPSQPAPIRYPDLVSELDGATSAEPSELMEAVVQVRRRKLPDPSELGNVGSFFENPVVDDQQAAELRAQFPDMPIYPVPSGSKLSAGWLIDQAGWKGHRRGGVGVSERHALVLVHYGNEKGQSLMELASSIQSSVQSRFGVWLQPEPRII